MGVPQPATSDDRIAAIRARHGILPDATVIAAFGGVSDEKRIGPLLKAVSVARAYDPQVRVLLVGQALPHYDALSVARDLGIDDIVTCTGYVPDDDVGSYLAIADVVSCLRWPSARETSASWLRAIAAGRATIVTDLAQQTDVPTLDPRSWTILDATPGQTARPAVAVSIDVLDEDHSLTLALKRLTADRALRQQLGAAAEIYWRANHTVSQMVADYEALLPRAARHTPPAIHLPAHLRPDGLEHMRALLAEFGDTLTSPLT
jgi:glycosyltransferase involved in cell wall biosynthesis